MLGNLLGGPALDKTTGRGSLSSRERDVEPDSGGAHHRAGPGSSGRLDWGNVLDWSKAVLRSRARKHGRRCRLPPAGCAAPLAPQHRPGREPPLYRGRAAGSFRPDGSSAGRAYRAVPNCTFDCRVGWMGRPAGGKHRPKRGAGAGQKPGTRGRCETRRIMAGGREGSLRAAIVRLLSAARARRRRSGLPGQAPEK